jgi:outer membrane receptor protein involved in Fe transport
MKLRRRRRTWPVLVGCIVAPVQAQDAEPVRLERVEIVGSHIKRADTEGPAPISTYSREEIEATGAGRVGEFLLTLPFAGAGSFDDRSTVLSSQLGAAGLSLRGLGPGATLVLLNGRRIAPYGVALDNDGTFVDLNSLPLAAVERIEILRDGASAIYGADAIGGVVNIVLRRDFRGVETRLRGGASDGDAASRYASVSLGAGDLATDRVNAFVVVDAYGRDAVPSTAREFSRSTNQVPRGGTDWRSPASVPPTVRIPGVGPRAGVGCPPEQVFGLGPDNPGSLCVFDFAPYADLLPKVSRLGLLAVGSVAATPSLRLFAELAANRTDTEAQVAAAGIFGAPLPAAVPTNPYGRDVLVTWRAVELGPRHNDVTVDLRSAVVGAEGAALGWDWSVAAGASAIDTVYRSLDQLRTSTTLAALEAGTLDPFSASNDAAVLAPLKVDALDRFEGRSRYLQAKSTTDLTRLTHGPLALALGVEHRRESFATDLDPLTIAGDLASGGISGTADASGRRTIGAAFAELNWPALAGVELQLAARYDHYSDYGASTSPKVAVRWQPAKTVLLRASAGRGFLPPTLPQIYKPRTEFIGLGPDPVRCPVTDTPEDCLGFDVLVSQQGNPELQPERSRQHNVGLVFEPVGGVSIGIDVWRIAHVDKVRFGDRYILENENLFPGHVVRAPASPEDIALGLPGPIIEFHDTYINVASRDTRGADLELKARLAPQPWGSVTVSALMSYLDRFAEQITPQSPAIDTAGLDGRPRVRAVFAATWQRGPWQTGVGMRYVGSYRYGADVDAPLRTVASWTVFDLQAGWSSRRNELLFAVRNLFDCPPPMRDDALGYDPAVHDPLGRSWSLSWRHAF